MHLALLAMLRSWIKNTMGVTSFKSTSNVALGDLDEVTQIVQSHFKVNLWAFYYFLCPTATYLLHFPDTFVNLISLWKGSHK